MKKFNILIIAFAIALIVIAINFLTRHEPDYGLIEVTDYVYVPPGEVSCDALIPECGYCPGEVTNNRCYIIRGQKYEYLDTSKYY